MNVSSRRSMLNTLSEKENEIHSLKDIYNRVDRRDGATARSQYQQYYNGIIEDILHGDGSSKATCLRKTLLRSKAIGQIPEEGFHEYIMGRTLTLFEQCDKIDKALEI